MASSSHAYNIMRRACHPSTRRRPDGGDLSADRAGDPDGAWPRKNCPTTAHSQAAQIRECLKGPDFARDPGIRPLRGRYLRLLPFSSNYTDGRRTMSVD